MKFDNEGGRRFIGAISSTSLTSLLGLILKGKIKQLDSQVSSTNRKLVVLQIIYALLSVILIILCTGLACGLLGMMIMSGIK